MSTEPAVEAEKTVTLEKLREWSISLFRKQQEAKRKAAMSAIAKAYEEIDQSHFQELLMTYKIENSLPLDRDVHLVTGKSL